MNKLISFRALFVFGAFSVFTIFNIKKFLPIVRKRSLRFLPIMLESIILRLPIVNFLGLHQLSRVSQ